MENQNEAKQEGKRIGAHPLLVIFGVIFGLWLFITMIIPKSKDTKHQTGMPSKPASLRALESISNELVPTFEQAAAVPELNALSLIVPSQTTDSQILALINHLRKSRQDGTLSTVLPPTTPGDPLGDFAIADIYIFSETEYAIPETARTLSRGAHVPGEFYPSSIPYEVAMEHVRGHYTTNLHNRTTPEKGSLGFGEDATGVYSKQYQPLF